MGLLKGREGRADLVDAVPHPPANLGQQIFNTGIAQGDRLVQGQQLGVVVVGLVDVLKVLWGRIASTPFPSGGRQYPGGWVPPCILQRVLPLTGSKIQYRIFP